MIILITGISSGFGRAMAEQLSADGHTVYGTHRNATDLLPGPIHIASNNTATPPINIFLFCALAIARLTFRKS